MHRFFTAIVILVSTLFASQSFATDRSWTLSNITGQVWLKKTGQAAIVAKNGDKFKPGDVLKTLSNAAAALTRDAEAMIISSDAELELPIKGNTESQTLVLQNRGTILFSAKKKLKKHFEIRTPFAAAIVKGTTFAISANPKNSQIQVFEGVVALQGKNRSTTHLIKSGVKSFVPNDAKTKIIVSKVLGAPKDNPHFGSDIKKLAAKYVKKISIHGSKTRKFTPKIETPEPETPKPETKNTTNAGDAKKATKITAVKTIRAEAKQILAKKISAIKAKISAKKAPNKGAIRKAKKKIKQLKKKTKAKITNKVKKAKKAKQAARAKKIKKVVKTTSASKKQKIKLKNNRKNSTKKSKSKSKNKK